LKLAPIGRADDKAAASGWAAFFMINEDVNARVLHARDVDPVTGIPGLERPHEGINSGSLS